MATILATSPDGSVVQFSDGSVYDASTGTFIDANGNPIAQTTVSSNPSAPPAQGQGGTPWDGIISSLTNFGSTMTSILTRTPVTVVGGHPVGVAGSNVQAQAGISGGMVLLLIGIIVVVVAVSK